jgi:hypothetical protein
MLMFSAATGLTMDGGSVLFILLILFGHSDCRCWCHRVRFFYIAGDLFAACILFDEC